MTDPARWLRDRADSFDRDRLVLYTLGWTDYATVFGTLRDELRRCADEFETAVETP